MHSRESPRADWGCDVEIQAERTLVVNGGDAGWQFSESPPGSGGLAHSLFRGRRRWAKGSGVSEMNPGFWLELWGGQLRHSL